MKCLPLPSHSTSPPPLPSNNPLLHSYTHYCHPTAHSTPTPPHITTSPYISPLPSHSTPTTSIPQHTHHCHSCACAVLGPPHFPAPSSACRPLPPPSHAYPPRTDHSSRISHHRSHCRHHCDLDSPSPLHPFAPPSYPLRFFLPPHQPLLRPTYASGGLLPPLQGSALTPPLFHLCPCPCPHRPVCTSECDIIFCECFSFLYVRVCVLCKCV